MGRGPGHLFQCGIVEALERSRVEVRVFEAHLPPDEFHPEIASAFALQAIVADRVARAECDGSLPIVLSGNCNTAIGTVAGLMTSTGKMPMVCWLDAHADFNTPETTTSGFLDGMAVSMLAGRCWTSLTSRVPGFKPIDESKIVMIGVRDIDGLEAQNLERSLIRRVGISALDADPVFDKDTPVYLHVDLDSIDTSEGRANSYAITGGLTRDELIRFVERIQHAKVLGALALTAYDPSIDSGNKIARIAIDVARAASA